MFQTTEQNKTLGEKKKKKTNEINKINKWDN